MTRKAVQIECSPRIKGLIAKELNRHQIATHYSKRMSIVYHCLSGKTNQEVSKEVGCLSKTVSKWRRRWRENQEILKEIEQGHEPLRDKELMKRIKEILSDKARPGSPPRISGTAIARLQALACEKPESYGLPFTNWTHEELSKQAKKIGIEVSPAHYGRLLKKRITPT